MGNRGYKAVVPGGLLLKSRPGIRWMRSPFEELNGCPLAQDDCTDACSILGYAGTRVQALEISEHSRPWD